MKKIVLTIMVLMFSVLSLDAQSIIDSRAAKEKAESVFAAKVENKYADEIAFLSKSIDTVISKNNGEGKISFYILGILPNETLKSIVIDKDFFVNTKLLRLLNSNNDLKTYLNRKGYFLFNMSYKIVKKSEYDSKFSKIQKEKSKCISSFSIENIDLPISYKESYSHFSKEHKEIEKQSICDEISGFNYFMREGMQTVVVEDSDYDSLIKLNNNSNILEFIRFSFE